MSLRYATLSDASELLAIYEPYIIETAITFEIEVPTVQEFQRRIKETVQKFPWLVYESNGRIQGFAYANPFRSRTAYAWSVESSIYVRMGLHGQGIGKRLYQELLNILKEQGVANVLGCMTSPNESSQKIHEYFGFEKVANLKDVGFKLGQWWDVTYWQLQLAKPEVPSSIKLPPFKPQN